MSTAAPDVEAPPAEQPAPAVEPTALESVNAVVAQFDRVAAGLADLTAKYKGVLYDVTTTAGLESAREARAAIREPRYAAEHARKKAKTLLTKLGKQVEARAEQITADLLALEEPIDSQIKAEETRKEQERERKRQAEVARVNAIQGRLNHIRGFLITYARQSAASIEEGIKALVEIPVDATFQEFEESARTLHAQVLAELRGMHDAQAAHETEQERLKAEREELKRKTAEQEEANKKERERIAAEEAEAKRKREAEEAAAKAQRDAQEAERQRDIEARMAQMKADREALQRQQELAEARMGEIQAMGHQVIIASTGRLGVRAGGTRECIVETLAETERWEVSEEKFGPLYPLALTARKSACGAIADVLLQWDARLERERLEAERVAADAARKQLDGDFAVQPVAQETSATAPPSEPLPVPIAPLYSSGSGRTFTTVPCHNCGQHAPRLGTKTCDGCYQIAQTALAEAQQMLGIPVIFTSFELELLAGSPEALQVIIDGLEVDATQADAADYREIVEHHNKRIGELTTLQQQLERQRELESR